MLLFLTSIVIPNKLLFVLFQMPCTDLTEFDRLVQCQLFPSWGDRTDSPCGWRWWMACYQWWFQRETEPHCHQWAKPLPSWTAQMFGWCQPHCSAPSWQQTWGSGSHRAWHRLAGNLARGLSWLLPLPALPHGHSQQEWLPRKKQQSFRLGRRTQRSGSATPFPKTLTASS